MTALMAGSFPVEPEDHLTSHQIQKILDAITGLAGVQEVKFRDVTKSSTLY
jgi:hypothetical protein